MVTPAMSRRNLLTYIGTAGAATLMTGTVFSIAQGKGSGNNKRQNRLLEYDAVVTVTMGQLKAMDAPNSAIVYWVTDNGQEGHPEDRATKDNTGIVIVSTSGARFKRVLESPYLNIKKWFGAKGTERPMTRLPCSLPSTRLFH